ncbi:chemotaxis protein CheD [Halobellus sp. GM3]|uniref:chemotaxis protein CheD n=1 Tax=Halobellus sp. GM3 TaxID=3458410 RepID=UPI00403D850C
MKVYTSDRSADTSAPERIKVGIADYAVAENDSTLVTSGLGSCVGIALVDAEAGVAGLAHAMLPSAGDAERADDARRDGTEAKYVDTAVPGLIESMTAAGADPSRIEARIAGGSAMFEFTAGDGGVGERNVGAAESVLAGHDIRIVGRDVGGDYGRSLRFEAATGELVIQRAHGETHTI